MSDAKKWNIIWRGCVPKEKGMHEDETYEKWLECDQGVDEFKSLEAVNKFWENGSVTYGEEGGSFTLYGGWRGSYQDLKNGKEPFYTRKRIMDEIRLMEEEE